IIYSALTKNLHGTSFSGGKYYGEDVEFLYDLTYVKDGERILEQKIFDAQMALIKEAEEFILLDIFLFNDEYNKDEITYPSQVSDMTDLLIQKKNDNPQMSIILITDPLNNFYGAYEQIHLKRLKESGIEVVVTDLNELRDSNPLISGGYRAFMQWFGTDGTGWIRNFFQKDGPKVNIRSIIKLANFKGNHRKVYVTEKGAIVSSSNPHDPSSSHSNVAVKFYGKSMEDLIKSELILVENPPELIKNWKSREIENGEVMTKVITEKAIYDSLKINISKSTRGDKIWVGIFYISDFDILKELGEATKRGVEVRIVADLNKDAFGLEKNGSPNRPALSELYEKYPDIQIRWYNTTGEQFHTKIAYFDFYYEDPIAILGSANFTRRNLRDLNLETDLELEIKKSSKIHREMEAYFQRIWNNEDGEFIMSIKEHFEDGKVLRTLWKIQEKLGLCTW
ncbi:MAG: phospholipase, partial [Tissierellia bacterium]|nr:phospholipase [Tissierellia bacterium]